MLINMAYVLTDPLRNLSTEQEDKIKNTNGDFTGFATYDGSAWGSPLTGQTILPGDVTPEAGATYGYVKVSDLPPGPTPPESPSYNWANTNLMTGFYDYFATTLSGDLYFMQSAGHGGGMVKLEAAGNFAVVANLPESAFSVFRRDLSGVLYVARPGGMKRVNDSGQLEDTNDTVGGYRSMCLGPDGMLYAAAGSNYTTLRRLNNSTGQWEDADLPAGNYQGIVLCADGSLLAITSGGAMLLLTASGNWETTTTVPTDYFAIGVIGPDGKFYATGGTNEGIKVSE